MIWVLVALSTLSYPGSVCSGTPPACSIQPITYQEGQVVDIIVYDGVSTYVPPSGTELRQAPSGTAIGANLGE